MRTTTIAASSEWTLRRITLDIPIAGFRDFITPYLISETASGRVTLVDPGPACGVASLKRALDELGVTHLDLVLLTHIHVDHAGGVGHLLKAYPDTKLVVHPRGTRHLIDPSRLWSSTVETLGKDVASAYGEILTVPAAQILPEHMAPDRFEIVDTPGHSQHHQCYIYHGGSGDLVFEGEAAGVYLGNGYLRPATPPKFFYETSAKSIEALKNRGGSAILMLYGHHGCTPFVDKMLQAALDQMALWRETVEGIVAKSPQDPLETLVERAVELLTQIDPHLATLGNLPCDVRDRETYFLHNSARGFVSAALVPEEGR